MRIGEILVSNGSISPAERDRALAVQKFAGGRLGTLLLEQGFVSEESLARALGKQHQLPYVTWVEVSNASQRTIGMVSQKLALRYGIIPYDTEGRNLKVAMKDPTDLAVLDELAFVTGRRVVAAVLVEARMMEALEKFYNQRRSGRFLVLSEKMNRQRTAAAGASPVPPAPPVPPPAAPVPGTPAPPPSAAPPAVSAAPATERTDQPIEVWGQGAGEMETPFLEETWPGRRPFIPPLGAAPPAPPPSAPAMPPPPAAAKPLTTEIPLEIELRPEEVRRLTGGLPVEQVAVTLENPLEVPAAAAPPIPPATVHEAARRMLEAETREDIADAAIEYLGPRYPRVALFIARPEDAIGWSARGEGVTPVRIRSTSIPFSEPSVFLNVKLSRSFFLGPLAELPRHDALAEALGERPPDCAVFPVTIKDRVVAFLYVDGKKRSISHADLAELRSMAAAMAEGFARYILRMKKARPA